MDSWYSSLSHILSKFLHGWSSSLVISSLHFSHEVVLCNLCGKSFYATFHYVSVLMNKGCFLMSLEFIQASFFFTDNNCIFIFLSFGPCWQETTLSIFSSLLSKIDQYSSMLYKSAFRIFDSEGTLNKGRVRGQTDSLGNTWN